MYYVVIHLTINFELKETSVHDQIEKFGHAVIMQKKRPRSRSLKNRAMISKSETGSGFC